MLKKPVSTIYILLNLLNLKNHYIKIIIFLDLKQSNGTQKSKPSSDYVLCLLTIFSVHFRLAAHQNALVTLWLSPNHTTALQRHDRPILTVGEASTVASDETTMATLSCQATLGTPTRMATPSSRRGFCGNRGTSSSPGMLTTSTCGFDTIEMSQDFFPTQGFYTRVMFKKQ